MSPYFVAGFRDDCKLAVVDGSVSSVVEDNPVEFSFDSGSYVDLIALVKREERLKGSLVEILLLLGEGVRWVIVAYPESAESSDVALLPLRRFSLESGDSEEVLRGSLVAI